MLFAFSLSPCVLARQHSGGAIAPPGVQAFINGGQNGDAMPSQPLTGSVTGGEPPLTIEHGWMADGSVVAGATQPTFTPVPGVNVPDGAEIQYAPTVNGLVYLSALLRLAPAVTVSLIGDFDGNAFPGVELIGVITGGLPDQFILHRWLADGLEIPGAVRAEFTPQLGANLAIGSMLQYAPIIEGLTFPSEEVVLAQAVDVSPAGDNALPYPVLMLDGQSINDLNLPYLDASYWVSNNNGAITVDVVVIRDFQDVPQPSSLTEEYEQGQDIRLEITVSDIASSVDYVVDMLVYPVPAAVVDGFGALSYVQGSGVQSVPFETFFEASSFSENWVAAGLNYVLLDAPVGVSLGSGTVQFDTDVLAIQTGGTVSLRASDTVTVGGIPTVRSATAEITFDIVTNAITLLEHPRVGDAASEQLFVGEAVADFSNRDMIIDDDPDLWTGLGNPGFRVYRTRRNGGASEILTLVAEEGDIIRPLADGYVGARFPGDGLGSADRTFAGNDVTIQNYLTFSAAQDGRLLTFDVNPNVPAARELVGLVVNGQPVLPGIVPADFVITAVMKELTAPAISFAVDGGLGDDLVYVPPTIIAPTDANVTWTFDLIDNSDQSVIYADQTILDNQITTKITAGLQGTTVFWRAKSRATGLPDLDIDSATIAIPAGVVAYPNQLFRTNTASLRNLNNNADAIPVNNGLATLSFWLEAHENGIITRQGNVGHILVRIDAGAVSVELRDSSGGRVWNIVTDVVAAGLNHYYLGIDLPNQTVDFQINGAAVAYTQGSATIDGNTGMFRDVGAIGLFATVSGGTQIDATFQELFYEFGALHARSLFDSDSQGNLPDLRSFGNPIFLIGTGDQTAADLDVGPNKAAGSNAFALEAFATGFTEV